MNKIILDLCGGSGSWSDPWKDNGYDVRVVDIKNGDDVRLFEKPEGEVYGILCAPPCTVFTVAGNRWKRSKEDYTNALSIVDACLRIVYVYKPKFWCLENPVGTLRRWLGPPAAYFNPCDYGDAYTKKTCLWGEFIMPMKLFPVKSVISRSGHHSIEEYHKKRGGKMGDNKKRSEIQSITPPGFAKAFYEVNRYYTYRFERTGEKILSETPPDAQTQEDIYYRTRGFVKELKNGNQGLKKPPSENQGEFTSEENEI